MKKIYIILCILSSQIYAFNFESSAYQAGEYFFKGITSSIDPNTSYYIGKNLSKGMIEELSKHLNDEAIKKLTNQMNKEIIEKLIINNAKTIAIISFISTLGYFSAAYGIPTIIKAIERRLMKPKLITESSKKNILEKVQSKLVKNEECLPEMIFNPELQQKLNNLIKTTSMIHHKIKDGKTNIKYRNLLLYGSPGTGKTMFAKKLAKESGLEYAFMSGSSFAKFNDGNAINALDELFAWAKQSNGLMLFIDEAETFLSKRENMNPQSKAYLLLNNFLNYTGERSSRFMIVFSTNHKNVLDDAMHRRIDDLIEMPLPLEKQRFETLRLYRNIILMDEKQNELNFVKSVKQCLNDERLAAIAKITQGLSYGDLEGIINTLKTDSLILEPEIITPELVTLVVERALKKHSAFTNSTALEKVYVEKTLRQDI